MNGFLRDGGVDEFEGDVAHRLVAQRSLARAPLEALDHGGAHGVQQRFVHFGGQRVVDQHVRALHVRTESPNTCRGKGEGDEGRRHELRAKTPNETERERESKKSR